jgi:DNA repair protein RadA/Sms
MKIKSNFRCSNCGFISSKWLGKCTSCGSWDKFVEQKNTNLNYDNKTILNSKLYKFSEIEFENAENTKLKFSANDLNDFWNGGIVRGSLTLLAGEPGLGKSTLALQILRSLVKFNQKLKFIYITAEESLKQLTERSIRLDIPQSIYCMQSNSLQLIIESIKSEKPDLVIIDSIQTVLNLDLQSPPGSVSQVSSITDELLNIAKSLDISIILIGHVTKEGQIAGPKTLEHMVDSVLTIEVAEKTNYRTVSFSKHRYGSVDQLLLMQMTSNGLIIVHDASLAMLENIETGQGVVYGLALDKNLPLVLEIQTLLIKNTNKYAGIREVIGIKKTKFELIIAILSKHLNLNLNEFDIFTQILGLPRAFTDDSLDLAIAMSILSAYFEKDIHINSKKASVYAGRLTLTGDLRVPTNDQFRQSTSKKLNLEYNKKITFGKISNIISLF